MSKLLRGLAAGILVISSTTANAGLIGDTVDIKDRFGTQSAVVGAGSETRTGGYGLGVSHFIDLSDNGLSIGLVNSSATQWDWSGSKGDFWEVLNMDSVVDSSAVISGFSQVTGHSLYSFDTSFTDHGIRVDMAGLSPFSVASGDFVRFDFSFDFKAVSVSEPATYSLLGLGLLAMGFVRRKAK